MKTCAYILGIALAVIALVGACGCATVYLDQTWPDKAVTHLRATVVLSDQKINQATFYRDRTGKVIVVMGGFSNEVNAEAVGNVAASVGTAVGAIARMAILGVP